MHTDVSFTRKTGAARSSFLCRVVAFESRPATDPFAPDTRTGKICSTALSSRAFCQRMTLLAELELPCTVHIANRAFEQLCNGVIRCIEHTDERLSLFGEGFVLHLCARNIAAIGVVIHPGDGTPAVEIHSKSGALLTRIVGPQDRIGRGVWQDVMGNPSLSAG